MMQSLIRLGRVADLVAGYGHVIVDECHHVPAVSFERVLSEVKARFVTGLTATPRRRDGQQPILHMQLGPARFAVDSRNKNAQRPFVQSLIVRETEFAIKQQAERTTIQELYSMLAADPARNNLICKDVIQALEDGRSPIVLTERREHLERLADELRVYVPDLVVLHGTMKTSTRREALAHFATVPDGKPRLLLATGRYIGEGFDDARLDTLVSRPAGVVERDADSVLGPSPSSVCRQDRSADIRLRRPKSPNASSDVRKASPWLSGDGVRPCRG